MTKRGENINNDHTDKLSKDLLQKMDVRFPRSKEDIWEQIQKDIENKPEEKKVRVINISRISYSLAAVLLILLMSASFARYFRVTINAKENAEKIILACNSEITLYDGSISYNPLWWKIKRNVKLLNGNADFEVRPGKRFTVVSDIGVTEVLGTKFNITAGSEKYAVTCFSGRVKVKANINDVEAILTKNEKAVVNTKGVFNVSMVEEELNTKNINKNDYISFKNQGIQEVFSILESEFNLEIVCNFTEALSFTGNFKLSTQAEPIIAAICRPLNLSYERVSDNKYIIKKMEETP